MIAYSQETYHNTQNLVNRINNNKEIEQVAIQNMHTLNNLS